MEIVVPKSTRWARANPEKARKAGREYYSRNRSAMLEKASAWKQANPDAAAEWRGQYRLRKHGITPQQYEGLLDRSLGCCEICRDPFVATPHIDHCHSTLQVRGLLCSGCNTGLGKFRDSGVNLQAAIRYLAQEPIPTARR